MRHGINQLTGGKAGQIYEELIKGRKYGLPHEFVKNTYENYRNNYPNNPNINGRIFEYLICETLLQQSVVPFYYQARFTLVPNADFDVALYEPKRPVVLTMKTSLRERYKQADLEGWALRQVYRGAESYLVTLSLDEATRVKDKIASGEVMGIKACLVASTTEYDSLLEKLQRRSFCHASPLTPCEGNFLR